ncbi:MAG: hypothetical protein J6W21_06560 [Bacteroidaceae bacterium]|nr:hypothetical protein [Bacteroidaceae bacterium]
MEELLWNKDSAITVLTSRRCVSSLQVKRHSRALQAGGEFVADFSYFLPFCIILNLVEGRIELHQTLQVLARSFYPCYLLLLCRYLAIKS